MTDNVNHPAHYTRLPAGLSAECIQYTRHMGFDQGNAFKYVYRLGAKGNHQYATEDLAKAEWYLADALAHEKLHNVYHVAWGVPVIDPTASPQAEALYHIARGHAEEAFPALEQLRLMYPWQD